ncbi:polysaccharide pyruvyl transferase family protein [Methanoculleus sediminis]|uniref:polysaccharide pyruvyl transferase family protein n=1 Tax=Methanoculleus sediminis TaxID=1550566 RepID=UPI0009E1FA6B|nr:polysaccharide pyruvyl transferase family protein [Methanoculleus sediminis]
MIALLLNVGVTNKGNEALVISTKKIIQDFREDIKFINVGAEGDDKNQIVPHIARNPTRSPYPWLYLIECVGIRALRRCGFAVSVSKKSKLSIYNEANVVINSGGDQLSGEKIIGSSFLNLLYPLLLDKPVVLFAESLGYYKYFINRLVGRYIFRNAKLILVREELSKEYLIDLGIDAGKIFVTADPAFILPPAPLSRVNEILSVEGISCLPNPIVGVNPSGLISRYFNDPEKSEDHYVQSIADVIDYLIETKEASVLLIPHVYSKDVDDRIVIQKVMKKVLNPQKVFQIANEYSATELKGIIGLCDMFIGSRMHATIAATSLCVPTIGISYSHKIHGIVGKTLGLERYIIDINKLDSDVLKSVAETVWSDRSSIKKHLENVIPEVKEKSLLNGHLFAKYLESDLSPI